MGLCSQILLRLYQARSQDFSLGGGGGGGRRGSGYVKNEDQIISAMQVLKTQVFRGSRSMLPREIAGNTLKLSILPSSRYFSFITLNLLRSTRRTFLVPEGEGGGCAPFCLRAWLYDECFCKSTQEAFSEITFDNLWIHWHLIHFKRLQSSSYQELHTTRNYKKWLMTG